MKLIDVVFSVLLLTIVAVIIFYIFKGKAEDEECTDTEYSLDYLCDRIQKIMNSIINMDINHLNLNKRDLENRRMLKRTLSNALRKCSQGDMKAKIIVVSRIKHTLLNMMRITEDDINGMIPFHDGNLLSAKDKFDIMMYLQKRSGSQRMFQGICERTGLDKLLNDGDYYYCIADKDIDEAYTIMYEGLSFDDKLNILSQRIYEKTYGLSVADILIMEDISLDSISGGVSGITTYNFRYMEDEISLEANKRLWSHESIWVVYQGKPIHLKFLAFESVQVIKRICKNLAEHGRMGHLTSAEGGIKTHLADGSRVTVFRPNNASQWAFFVRKFANTASFELKDLIRDDGYQYPIEVIKWAIHGCVNLFFSGDQNSGKTTYTRAAVREIDKRQPIRTLEADFELYLGDAYSDKNILGTRPSEKLPFDRVIELLKSSEAHTILFGEIASLEHAKHLINLLLAGTKRIITTGHWPTSDELVAYFVHALGGYGGFDSGDIQSMVARLIHLDVHCVKDNDGHRYIERITEIIPYEREEAEYDSGEIVHYLKLLTRKKAYYTRDIIRYTDGRYERVNPISNGLAKIMLNHLPPDRREAFLKFNAAAEGGAVISF